MKGTLALVRGRIEHWNEGGEIGYTITGGDIRDTTPTGDRWEHYRWTGRFTFQGRRMQIGFMRGMGLPGVPDAEELLAAAFSDAQNYRDADGERDFIDSYGYDPEEPGGARIYRACQRMDARLDRFFGHETYRENWYTALDEEGKL